MLCAVELSMRSVNARVALCQLLWANITSANRAVLMPQQFELVVRLINCALSVNFILNFIFLQILLFYYIIIFYYIISYIIFSIFF